MFATINTDAFNTGAFLTPILVMEQGPEDLGTVCQRVGNLETIIYPLNFQCGPNDFLNDLKQHKNHFICLVRSGGQDVGYLVAWRNKINTDLVQELFDDSGITLCEDEKQPLLAAVKAAFKDGKIRVVYVSDVAVLDAFRRGKGLQHPPILELLGLFAAWAKPKPGKPVFLRAETRVRSSNLTQSLVELFPGMVIQPLLNKEYFDEERRERMRAQIYQITATT